MTPFYESISVGEKYKKAFDFVQRKVEYENYRFKYPSLVGVVVESIDHKVLETQRKTGSINYRFHISYSLTLGEIAEVIKFKILLNPGPDDKMKLTQKDRVILFSQGNS